MHETVAKLFCLDGNTAIVTGGNGGIGKGIARALAGAGANVVIAARNEAKTAEAAREIEAEFGVRALGVKVDVRREDQILAMVQDALREFGRIDVLVSNAGMAIHKHPEEMSVAEWDDNIETNLRSFFISAKAVHPVMKSAGRGKIISIGSMFAFFGCEALPAYGASKGGIVQLTKSLAVAWAPHNIQVNSILPGFINTDLSADGKRDVPGMAEGVVARTPAGRWGEPEDIAGTAIFLASRASDFITGAAIPVDGGFAVKG
jgi:2-dehydro-3-deoxy-D-gluconate 5-dehydrogenase